MPKTLHIIAIFMKMSAVFHRRTGRVPLLIPLLAYVLLAAAGLPSRAAEVVGYYPAWVIDELPANDVRFDVFTRIVYAFAWPDSEASIVSYNPPAYRDLIEAAHAAGRTVSISFGGGGQTAGFPKVTADPGLRAAFVWNILDFCGLYGYDGADFDWEFPGSETERDNYALLVRELREAADAQGRSFLISMAVAAASWPSFGNDFADLSDAVDWFMVMTYNYAGPWSPVSGHNAPLYARYDLGYSLSVARSIDYMIGEKGFPRERLVLGMPFYGREFSASVLYGTASGGAALWYTAIRGYLDTDLWTRRWDDISKVPYLTDANNTKLVTYDDPESVALKCRYALDQGLAGVGVWAMGYDATASGQPLVDAIGPVFGGVHVTEADVSGALLSPIHLAQNYPNPFNPVTTVEYRLERGASVVVSIHNAVGQTVAVLAGGAHPPGTYTVAWKAAGLPSGVYICRLAAGNHVASVKMLLIK